MIPPWVLSIIWSEALFQASFKAPGHICLGLECHVFAKGSHRIPASESTHWVCTHSLSRFLLPFPNLQILAPHKLLFLFYLPFSNTFTVFSFFFSLLAPMVHNIFLYIPLLYLTFQLFFMNPYQDLSLSFSFFQVFSYSLIPAFTFVSYLLFFISLCSSVSHSTRGSLTLLFPVPPD